MPVREARALLMQREYFADFEFQTELTPEQREVYMGLWQLADNAGWLDWIPGQIIGHVYRFDPVNGFARLQEARAALERTGRLRVYQCHHARLPRGTGYGRIGRPGNNPNPVFDAHEKHSGNARKRKKTKDCLSPPVLTSPVLTSTSPDRGNGKSNLTNASERAPARGARTPFGQAIEAAGFDLDTLAKPVSKKDAQR